MKAAILTAILTGLFTSALALYPQWHLRTLRGAELNGAFATYDLDEMAYAAYLQALIDGRPRKNDPYTGRDDSTEKPQPESLFSIQFVTAYFAAVPARVLGLSATEMMPVISAVSGFLTAIALFWLAFLITRSSWLSAAVVLTVIAGGALISGIGVISEFKDGGSAYPYLPFLRRHIPSLSFPFLFALFACLWKGFHADSTRKTYAFAVLAAGCFAVLMFSYFYLWTTAASVIAVLAAFMLVGPREDRSRSIKVLAVFAVTALPVAILYLLLLSGRSATIDQTQLLVLTRQPDLFRNIEMIGLAVGLAAALLLIFKFKGVTWHEGSFVAAFGLTPLLVFNQQVISGRSLQPFHYEYYSANYVAALALILLFTLLIRRVSKAIPAIPIAASIMVIAAAITWGMLETVQTTKLWDDINVVLDKALPVNQRVRQLAVENASSRNMISVNFDSLQADSQPSVAPAAVLWARHQSAFAGLADQEENRSRYYKLLYYSGFDSKWLKRALTGCENIEACMALFGWDRFNSTLSANARPLTAGEIESEVRSYERFASSFSRANAYEPKLDLLVETTNDSPDLERLREWYEVGEPEVHGAYQIRRLTAK